MGFLVSDTPDKKVYKCNADLPKTLKDVQMSKNYGVPIIMKLEKVFTNAKKANAALGLTKWDPKKPAPINDMTVIRKGMNYKTKSGSVYAIYTHKMTQSELKAEQDFINKKRAMRKSISSKRRETKPTYIHNDFPDWHEKISKKEEKDWKKFVKNMGKDKRI